MKGRTHRRMALGLAHALAMRIPHGGSWRIRYIVYVRGVGLVHATQHGPRSTVLGGRSVQSAGEGLRCTVSCVVKAEAKHGRAGRV